jgi:hypothetical protein
VIAADCGAEGEGQRNAVVTKHERRLSRTFICIVKTEIAIGVSARQTRVGWCDSEPWKMNEKWKMKNETVELDERQLTQFDCVCCRFGALHHAFRIFRHLRLLRLSFQTYLLITFSFPAQFFLSHSLSNAINAQHKIGIKSIK